LQVLLRRLGDLLIPQVLLSLSVESFLFTSG
jgi:hypothetical protein